MTRLRIKAWILLLTFGIQIFQPLTVFALTGGPSQPEVQSFTPVGVSDMVDLFSGDFKYNIPLLDVDGYPVNLAYTGGVSMDQEASWVGLGWNINCGVINRNMRGVPDDFKGDRITKSFNMKPNETYSANISMTGEFFGLSFLKGGMSLAANYNNYNGFSITQGLQANLTVGEQNQPSMTAGLSLTNSTMDGLSVAPSLSFSAKARQTEHGNQTTSFKVGCSFNSRAGLTQLSVSISTSEKRHAASFKNGKTVQERSVGSEIVSSSFDLAPAQYAPNIEMQRTVYSQSASFTFDAASFAIHGGITLGGGFTRDQISENISIKPTYGLLYSSNGQHNDNAALDFIREKDMPYTDGMKSIGFAGSTPDVFSVMGQGVGGSYRLTRNDIGYYFDPVARSTSGGGSIGVEIGYGVPASIHGGGNISLTKVNSRTGCWRKGNTLSKKVGFQNQEKGKLYEPVYFKEANDKTVDIDKSLLKATGGYTPVRVGLKGPSGKTNTTDTLYDLNGNRAAILLSNPKNDRRVARPNSIRYVTVSKRAQLALEDRPIPSVAKDHHIAEISVLGEDGKTYYYGAPLYNLKQHDITFSIGSKSVINSSAILNTLNYKDGTIEYSNDDASTKNDRGIDNFYSETRMPAYAHSYLITSIVSADYSDIDNIKGPSDNDLGTYTRFDYHYIDNFKWRTPYGENKAFYNEGLKSDYQDDKASFVYGEKQLAYLSKIETKNYIAIFDLDFNERKDGLGVSGRNGGKDGTAKLPVLKKIKLFNKKDYLQNGSTAIPVKTVHFVYNYSLCKGIPNTNGNSGDDGKLTLTEVYFTFGTSNRGSKSKYEFSYTNNFIYNEKYYDRWGGYKLPYGPNAPNSYDPIYGVTSIDHTLEYENFYKNPLAIAEFPYTERNNEWAAPWILEKIHLPSGGIISLEYEQDDYAYVQNKQAMQMVKITGATNDLNNISGCKDSTINHEFSFEEVGDNPYFIFPLQNLNIGKLKDKHKGEFIYFRFFMNIIKGKNGRNHPEFVSGYGKVDNIDVVPGNSGYGFIKFQDVKLQDNGSDYVSPIYKTGIQFGRINLPKAVWDTEYDTQTPGGLTENFLSELVKSNVISGIKEALQGVNAKLKTDGVAEEFISNRSFVRLVNTDGHKPGGGYRVKSIKLSDNWKDMADPGNIYNYSNLQTGQEYNYTLEDGSSSGVASYEPQIGGDENPYRVPEFYEVKKLMVPNDISYVEEPFGESFFPAPGVGYSRVVVKNIKPAGNTITRHGSGAVENLFYTAKDFPVITKRTSPKMVETPAPSNLSALGLVSVLKRHMVISQGFYIETNDMHGKPKATKIYREGEDKPIKHVEYRYKTDPTGSSLKLNNTCKVILSDGSYADAEIGVNFETNFDFRESVSKTKAPSLGLNMDGFPFGLFPSVTWMVWPKYVSEEVIYRSVSMVKNVYKTGILEETIVTEEGSSISTKNLAYDAETGGVLLTETSNEFKDPIFNMKYPAYWHYKRMGPAYRNTGFTAAGLDFVDGVAQYANAKDYFIEGDQLFISNNGAFLGWVKEVRDNEIVVILRDGSFVANMKYDVEVVKSGYKNQIITEMQNMTTLSNPLDALSNNNYANVINSAAIEYSNKWKTYCDCFSDIVQNIGFTSNPFVTGILSDWRPWKSFSYLTDRNQAKYNDNSNIRHDGFLNTYTPFYKNHNGKWVIDLKNWTYTSEITEWHPYGAEIENRNALGIYSSSVYGYNQTLPLLVSGNARYNEVAFDGFEDYGLSPCSDDHFKFDHLPALSKEVAHTGRHSFKVPASSTLSIQRSITSLNDDCVQSKGCVMKLIQGVIDNSATPSSIPVQVAGGQAPYNFQYTVISGNAFFQFGLDQTSIYCRPDPGAKVSITVTDAEGCTNSLQINH